MTTQKTQRDLTSLHGLINIVVLHKYRQSIILEMWGQTSLSNAGSDSLYLLLLPSYNLFCGRQHYPIIFHTRHHAKEKIRESDTMFGIPTPSNQLF